ncbi:MAG: alpha/beta fold hydrolase [Pseudomonadales bacterium]|nr:alpha/beta fold hydrolase [Pseudomonadales bacterium]
MSRLFVTLSGNPGAAADLDALISALGQEDSYYAFERPIEGASLTGLLQLLEAGIAQRSPTSVVVIAYSWGSYLALKWAQTTSFNIERLVLINPTVEAENPISGLVKALVGAPIVGDVLLKKVAASKTPEFIEHSFAPQQPSASVQAKMFSALNNPSIWKGAVRYKSIQQTHPLVGEIKHKLTVFKGAADKAITWNIQWPKLKSLVADPEHISLHEIDNAGHALPWTHVEQLAAQIKADLKHSTDTAEDSLDLNLRIGYQPGETVNNNITCYLERHLERYPERSAIRWVERADIADFNGDHKQVFTHHQITYGQFAEGIRAVAKGLSDLGITKGDRVILFLPMSVGMYTAMCAIQRLGAVAVFLDSWARRKHLGASAECVDPKAMISHKLAFDLVKEVPEFNSMKLRVIAGPGNDGSYDAQLEELFKSEGEAPVAAVESETTALITFTTGSSGKPKGANRTHRFLAAQHEALWEVIPYNPDDSDMPAFPIFSLNNLASGVTTVLPAIDLASPNEKDPAALVSQILSDEISCTTLSPSMLNHVSAYCIANKVDLPSLRRVVTGGAPISKDNVKDFKSISPNAEIWILYGSTEVEPMAHIEAVEMLSLPEDPDPEIIEVGVNVGHISEDLRYKFIKPKHDNIDYEQSPWSEIEVPKGQVGEFIVTGDHVCQDYFNNPEAFFKTKIKDDEGAVWHRTGDLARIDDDGYLWVVGRIHNMIARGDEYYFPVSAEIILKRFDFVNRCAFLGLPDTALGERTAVAIQVVDGYDDIETGMADIQRVFDKNNILIDSFFVVDEIPMDPRHHSKVEYAILREQILESDAKDLMA